MVFFMADLSFFRLGISNTNLRQFTYRIKIEKMQMRSLAANPAPGCAAPPAGGL
jgi:hypothetical protein